MSWFQSANLTNFAKTALKEAQKTIDKALEISEEGSSTASSTSAGVAAAAEAASDFFSSWGVQVGSKKGGTSKIESTEDGVTPIPILPPSYSSIESKVGELESFNSNEKPRNQSSNHKRSASLEMSETCVLPLTPMHRSLTSEIPVTLIAPNCSDSPKDVPDHLFRPGIFGLSDSHEKSASNGHSQPNHTRSLSDTVFNSPNFQDDFDGSLQVLDGETVDSRQTVQSNPIPTPVKSQNPQHFDTTLTSKLEDISNNGESFLEFKVQTVPSDESITSNLISNLDLLSTVDLGTLPHTTSAEPEAPPSTFPLQDNETTEPLKNDQDANVERSNEDGCCDNTWNWPDSAPSSSTNQPVPQDLIGLEPTNSESQMEGGPNNSYQILSKTDNLSASATVDSGIGLESSVGSTETWDKIETNLEEFESPTGEEPDNKWRSCSKSPSRSPHPSECHTTSPPPAESPRSATSPITPLDSRRESPNHLPLDLLSNAKEGTSASDNIMQEMSMPFGQHQQVESSRSSSIVVVSGRNSTPSGSAASTGSSASEGHQEDHSHASSASYERVDVPPHSDPGLIIITGTQLASSRDFVKVKGKKGHSSASSSSDIEVIPSEFSSPGGDRKRLTTERDQQTSPIPSQEVESQTEEVLTGRGETGGAGKGLSLEISGLLREKDDMIEELREEGDKLSKKQFEVGQVVKKLRAKEKEMELSIKILKGELAGKSLENERLMKSYVTKEGLQQVQNETISKLTVEKRALDLKIEEMKSELEDANANCGRMKASVEEASVEMLELKNAILSFQRDSNEMDSLIRRKTELISRNEGLQKEVDHLRLTINSNQSTGSSRETELQSQISLLRRKVHSLENELADNSEIVADATMPLSLEIEKLQAQLKTSALEQEKRESALQSLVWDLELKMKSGLEREKSYKDLNLSLQTNVSNLEGRLEKLETENTRIAENFCSREKTERKEIEDRNVKMIRLEGQVAKLTMEVERLNEENHSLGLELRSEKSLVDSERKKSQSLLDQLSSTTNRNQLNQNHVGRNSVSMSNNPNLPKSGENSPSSHSIMSETSYLDEVFENGQNGMNNRSMTPKSFFESFSSLGLIENLQSQLRQRETEVCQFQDEVAKNEKIRRILNEEIAKLTMQNQEFQLEMERLAELQSRLKEMESNNNALLQMYGEKVEEADELRMDLQDVKDMYKTQIEQLLKK